MIPIFTRKSWLALAAVWALAAGATASPAVAQVPESPAPRPALWLLADEDTKIYLFGTVHVLPRDLVWRSPAVDRVIEEADELVMELTDQAMQESLPALQRQVMLGKEVPLAERISPDRRPALRQILARSGIPPEMFDGLQTWVAAIILGMAGTVGPAPTASKSGQAPPLSGAEDVLTAEFTRRDRPISGIETPETQFGFFGDLPLRTQRELLEQTVDALAAGAAPIDPEETDWVSGDVEAIGRAMETMPAELFTVLLTNRNRTWTDWLVGRLEQPGTVLFAVGAGHLAGRDSVQSMLQQRGLTITRLD